MRKEIIILIFLFFSSNYFVISKLSVKEEDFSLEQSTIYNNNNNYKKFLGKNNEIKLSYNNAIYQEEAKSNSFSWIKLENLKFFSYFHLILSFLIIPILSIILIIIDMFEDKTIRKKISLPSNVKIKNEYNSFKNTFIIKAKYLFSWFLFKFHYPITNIIFIYNYNHPRYIRLILYIMTLLFNTLLTSALYIIIVELDADFKINNASNIFFSLLFSFIISIIVDLILNFTLKFLFEFHEVRREIFKKKLETLRRYIYYDVKKDILFNSKWHFIRNRMIVYYRLCGSLLLRQVKKNKYQKYVKNKFKNANDDFLLFSQNSEITSNNSSLVFDNLNKTDIMSDKKEKNLNEGKKDNSQRKKSVSSLTKINDNKSEKIPEKINEKGTKNKFKISKGVESFSFSKFGINNMKLKTVKKIEEIKNRYINKKKDIKFDETREIDKDTKIFENLDIESLEGFTYISTDAMIDKLNSIQTNSNKMIINIFTGVMLVIILILINFGLMIIQMGETNKNPGAPIEKILLAIFIEVIVINFIIHRAICFFIAFSIHNFYGKKKRNCCYKLIFDIYYEKYIRYLYRIRLLITKYQKEFNFMEK